MNEQALLNEISNSIKYELNKRKIIKVEISARHVHLSQSDLEILFGSNYSLTPKRELSQPGQYLSEERVKLIGPKSEMNNVAILGPVRKNTQVELNEEQFAAAKKSSRRISGLYYKVEGKLTEKNHSIDLTLYLDTSNLKNITLEGILLRSDRGWEELEPGFLSNPNLITCGFIFLDGYDIDHDSFVDFSNELKERAVKRKNKYTKKYDLVLEDDDFGIKITFDSLKENSPKIYITQVTVTNKVNLAW